MSDFFQYDDTIKKKTEDLIKIQDPYIFRSNNPEVYILSDIFLSKVQIGILRKLLKTYASIEQVSILYTYDIKATTKDTEASITKFTMDHSIDFSEYIPAKSKIITLGRALYSITKDTSVQVSAFQDIVWNDTKFFDPKTKSWIFPTAWLMSIYSFSDESLISSYDLYHFKHQIKYAASFKPPAIRVPKLQVELVEDPNTFLQEHLDKKVVAWDLETSGFDCTRDKVRCVTMSFDGKTGYYLRWKDIDPKILNKFFEGKYQIGANLKFDCRFMHQQGVINAKPDFDTLHAGHALNEMRSNSLKTHAWIYTYYGGYDLPLEEYKKKYPKTKSYLLIPESVLVDYAAKDSIVTYLVWEQQKEHLAKDPELEKYFYEEIMPTVRMFVDIETQGVYINWENIRKNKEKLYNERQKIIDAIYKEVGREFNIASSKELSHILEFEMNLPFLGTRNKAGGYFTNEEHLTEWKKRGHKIAELLLEYRSYSALLNTFIGDEKSKTAYWEYKAPNGLIYPSYSVMMANSHRNKSNSPNMQQVPHHGDKAWMIRSFFDCPEEFKISEFDYSGFQLRIAAIVSGDENMKKAFVDLGGDLHSFTAQPIFCPDISLDEFLSKKKEDPYKEYRFRAKGINFGLLFGMGHFTYAANFIRKEWSLQECKDFCKERKVTILNDFQSGTADYYLSVAKYLRDTFFETYPGLVSWHESTHAFAKKNGYVRYIHGGRRLLPQLLGAGEDKKTEASLKNISLNSPVQNFEIVVISRAMRAFSDFCKKNNFKSRIWATVHDAVAFYIHKDEEKILGEKIPEILQHSYPEFGDIPIEVEGDLSDPHSETPEYWGYGKTWYEDQQIKF